MKQSSIVQLALFYLVLLVSHEGITVAHTIRQTIGLQKGAQLSSSLTNMVQMMENVDVDSFLEVEDMHGMSAEAYGTMEMMEMHKSLKEGFSFENSPILEDLKSLKEIPENKILSASELKGHRDHVSILLEKAMMTAFQYIIMFAIGWMCHAIWTYILSLGYSVLMMKRITYETAKFAARMAQISYEFYELKYLALRFADRGEDEVLLQKKLDKMEHDSIKESIVSSFIKNYPPKFVNNLEFDDWDSMTEYLKKAGKEQKNSWESIYL